MAGESVKTMGSGWVIPAHSVYEESSSQKHQFGARCMLPGGKVFAYCKNAAVALSAGLIVQQAAPYPNHKNRAVAATVAVGALKISVGMGATAAVINYYANGTLHCNDIAPEGHIYKVKSHLAIAGSDTVWFNLYDPVIEAMTISSEVTLTKDLYDSVIVMPNAAQTGKAIGVPLIDVTASYWFWAQVRGTAPVLGQGTLVVGGPVTIGGTADGAVGPCTAVTNPIFGHVIQVNASTEFSLIDLMLG